MIVMNGRGKCCWGYLDASGLVPREDTVNKIQRGAFLLSACICIVDYAHATKCFQKVPNRNNCHLDSGCWWSVENRQ